MALRDRVIPRFPYQIIATGGIRATLLNGVLTIEPDPDNLTAFLNVEGSWTPTIAGSTTAGAQTYSVQVGRYVKVGNLVQVTARLTMTAKDGTTAGNLEVRGLPFTSRNVTNLNYALAVGPVTSIDLAVGKSQYSAIIPPNSTAIQLHESGDNVASAALVAAALAATSSITLTGTYLTG